MSSNKFEAYRRLKRFDADFIELLHFVSLTRVGAEGSEVKIKFATKCGVPPSNINPGVANTPLTSEVK